MDSSCSVHDLARYLAWVDDILYVGSGGKYDERLALENAEAMLSMEG